MDLSQLQFFEELEDDIRKEDSNDLDKSSIVKTKYDMKSSSNKLSNSMHEVLGIQNLKIRSNLKK